MVADPTATEVTTPARDTVAFVLSLKVYSTPLV
jgi:hypothetical protein